MSINIIPYQRKYRDDLIFMVLEAKDALGRVPGLNEDLLDIEGVYLDKGDMFWLAVNENDRVVGSVGCNLLPKSEAAIHRLYVKATLKRQGIGSALLKTAEDFTKSNGRNVIKIHLGEKKSFFESRKFYPKHGYTEYKPDYMEKHI